MNMSGNTNTNMMQDIIPPTAQVAVYQIAGRKEMFYVTTHSTHFLFYGYMASGMW